MGDDFPVLIKLNGADFVEGGLSIEDACFVGIPGLKKVDLAVFAQDRSLRAEVYMVNMKHFTNLKWGTMSPVAFRYSELGLIRLRAHGVFNIQIR